MRAIWTGVISFELVNVPVKVYPATQKQKPNLGLIRKNEGDKVGYQYVSKSTGEKVDYQEVSRGFETATGEYVSLSETEVADAIKSQRHVMAVKGFVKPDTIPPELHAKPYYLAPKDSDSADMYILFRQALRETGRAALVQYLLKHREHVGYLYPQDGVISLIKLRYQAEIRSAANIPVPETTAIDARQLELTKKLIQQMAIPFDPSQYQDTYVSKLKDIIRQKSQTDPKAVDQPPTPTDIREVLHKLQQSLDRIENQTLRL